MPRKKSPQLKKQDEYDRDHRTRMENPHAFRKNWPKKKARANRRDRAALRSLLADPAAPDDLTPAHLRSVTARKAISKSSVMPLRQKVATGQRARDRASDPPTP